MTIRAVLDANVFVSAAINRGASHRIVQAWLQRQAFELVISEGLLAEFDDVLRRPRIAKLISPEDAAAFSMSIRTLADLVDDPSDVQAETRDPDDDYLIALARANDAEVIVTGDLDLLEWKGSTPRTVPPAEFEQMLGTG